MLDLEVDAELCASVIILYSRMLNFPNKTLFLSPHGFIMIILEKTKCALGIQKLAIASKRGGGRYRVYFICRCSLVITDYMMNFPTVGSDMHTDVYNFS